MAILLSLSKPPTPLNRISRQISYTPKNSTSPPRREFLLEAITLCLTSLSLHTPPIAFSAPPSASPPSKSILSGIANTKSWFQFFGDGFAIRIPPEFQDVAEPEDFNAGATLYGDKAKPKTFAARFASTDGLEVAAKIFVPGGATLYTARTIKIKEDEGYRTYYYYEFGRDQQHVALVAAVNGGRTFVAGASSPESSWDSDGVKLRSAAISLTLL